MTVEVDQLNTRRYCSHVGDREGQELGPFHQDVKKKKQTWTWTVGSLKRMETCPKFILHHTKLTKIFLKLGFFQVQSRTGTARSLFL